MELGLTHSIIHVSFTSIPISQLYIGFAVIDDSKQYLDSAKSVLHPPKLLLHIG